MSIYLASVLKDGAFGKVFNGSPFGAQEDVPDMNMQQATEIEWPAGVQKTTSTRRKISEDFYCLAHPNIVTTFMYNQSEISPMRSLTSEQIIALWMMQDWCDRG